MITAADIEAAVTSRHSSHGLHIIESRVLVPLLGEEVAVTVFADPGCDTISPRQLGLLADLLAVGPERLSEVKAQLYDRWDQYNLFYTDDIAFEYDSAEEAFEVSRLRSVTLCQQGAEDADAAQLRFAVPWDPEHGARILYRDKSFRWTIA